MSGLDVEALLESTANDQNGTTTDQSRSTEPAQPERRNGHHDRNGDRGGGRQGSNGNRHMNNSLRDNSFRRRSQSRDSHNSGQLRESDDVTDRSRPSGDFYRGSGRHRSRSRSPRRDIDRHYRPRGDDRHGRDDRRDRGRGARDDRRRSRSPYSRRSRTPPRRPQLSEEERDKRTVFVQQLAARLRTKDLHAFFERVGPVVEAQIVKDRVSKRSKGVGYVEFQNEESVQEAINLTGQKLLNIPIIAQLTEAEKNRQARNPGESSNNNNSVPFHRLYVGNIHFSITEEDLQNVFEPFGELEFVQLQTEEGGRSKGYGFVQFREPEQAKEALEKMNGFELASRPIRVGLGNDKFTQESTANLMHHFDGRSHGQQQRFQGSSFSGSGGRSNQVGGSFDRSSGRDNDNTGGGASALDDGDVAGVNFNNYNRDVLMRRLARTDEPSTSGANNHASVISHPAARPAALQIIQPSRCIVLRNMFDPAQETDPDWSKELEDDIRTECEDKYGHVVHISVDTNSQGDVFVKFDRAQGGENAIKGLNGRYFGGRMITAQPMVDAVYNSQFPRSRNL